jgi:hypothetical protein
MALAILRLGPVEVRTDDEVTVRTLWSILATAVPARDRITLADPPPLEPEWPGP